jgi:hypothetical protein
MCPLVVRERLFGLPLLSLPPFSSRFLARLGSDCLVAPLTMKSTWEVEGEEEEE